MNAKLYRLPRPSVERTPARWSGHIRPVCVAGALYHEGTDADVIIPDQSSLYCSGEVAERIATNEPRVWLPGSRPMHGVRLSMTTVSGRG